MAGNQGWPSKATTPNQTSRGSTERAPRLDGRRGRGWVDDGHSSCIAKVSFVGFVR